MCENLMSNSKRRGFRVWIRISIFQVFGSQFCFCCQDLTIFRHLSQLNVSPKNTEPTNEPRNIQNLQNSQQIGIMKVGSSGFTTTNNIHTRQKNYYFTKSPSSCYQFIEKKV